MPLAMLDLQIHPSGKVTQWGADGRCHQGDVDTVRRALDLLDQDDEVNQLARQRFEHNAAIVANDTQRTRRVVLAIRK